MSPSEGSGMWKTLWKICESLVENSINKGLWKNLWKIRRKSR